MITEGDFLDDPEAAEARPCPEWGRGPWGRGMSEAPRRGRTGRRMAEPTVSVEWPQLFPVAVQSLETDERYTPEWVFQSLDVEFDLDVAAPVGGVSWIPAKRYYTAADDGLAQPWEGFVWCNPPFSQAEAFARRFLEHNNGIGVFPLSQAKWVGSMLAQVDRLNIPTNIKFESPSHSGRHVSFAVAIAGVGPRAHVVSRLPDRSFVGAEVSG